MTRFKLKVSVRMQTTEIGILTLVSDTEYKWEYADGIIQSVDTVLQGLPFETQTHTANHLFEWFETRIPPRERTDWQERLGMKEYNYLEIFRKTRLRLATDFYWLEEME